MKRAAVGFRVHSGWTAMVALAIAKGSPAVLVRRRINLVQTFTYEFRQPYHTAEKLPLEEARAFVARMRSEARRLALCAVRALKTELHAQGYSLTGFGLLLSSGRPLPAFAKILAAHALIHSADGELFRAALLHAAARTGLKPVAIRERELTYSASRVLRRKPADLTQRISDLGRPLGPPWSQDEKFASLVAWLAALSPSSTSHSSQAREARQMFCPVCKSEYRDGFTKCSDCEVDLVGQLADDSEAKEPLWAGQDASVRDAICERLDAAKILHEDDSVESQFMPAFRQSIYRIEIRKKDHDAALNAVRDIYLDQPSARPSPRLVLDRNSELLNTARAKRGMWGRMIGDGSEECEPSSAPKIPTNAPPSGNRDESAEDLPDDQLESFSPNEATSQVWSGPEREMAQNIDVCLREVGIGCVVNESSGNFNVCVERASEIRAKEIIREIIEQTPPE